MEIKDIQGNILIDALVTEQAVKVDELMKQHSITLSWVSVTDEQLPLGAYIEHEGVRYSLLAPYNPEQSDEATYAYKPVFEHPIMRWQHIPFFFYTYSEGKVISKELDWSLTDNPANFMKAVCDAILNETGEDWSYEISAELPASASQSFGNTDIFSALNAIAGAFETEWWFDYANKIVYLSKAAYGDAVTLEVGQNIGVPSKNQSKEGYYTRFYAFGSTRNIDQSYAGSNVNSIVNRRLTLNPEKYPNGYIDIREGLTESEILVKTLVFDDIYPRSSLTISDVKVRLMWRLDDNSEKVQIGTDSEGNPVYDQYAIWYFKIPELSFSKDMLIEGKALSVHFNSGALNGREFELTYHDTAKEVTTSDGTSIQIEVGDYEINFIEEGTYIIPAITGLVPMEGDVVTLFNIVMPEEYKVSAYEELEQDVRKKIAKQGEDRNNYTFNSNKVAFFESNPNLAVGRNVLYKNGSTTLATRVIRLETQLDYAFEQKITIGNEQIKGTTQTLKEEVVNANQSIDLLAAINENTEAFQQSLQRTQKAVLDSMAKWGDMWSLDAIKGIVRTRYNIVSEQEVISNRRATGAGSGTGSGYGRLDNWAEWDADTMLTYVLSAKLGVSLNERLKNIELNGSGLKEDDLKKYLDDNKYLQEGDIAELKATVDGLDDLLNGGTKEVIDTWNEVVAFLDGYKDSEDLATILSGMNTDIANRVLIEDFEKLEEAVLAIDISGLSNRLDVAEQAIKTNATAIATNATNITNLNKRVKTLEDLGLTLEGDAETGYYIKSAYSFVSQGEIISNRRASGSGSGGGGGISEITAQMITDALGYVPYSSLNPAGYITSSALSGYATEAWVRNNYQPKGNYLTSVSWDIVSGKPSFATVATSGKYSDLSGTPSSLPASDVYDWAKAATKPSYTASEVGALSTSGGTITGLVTFANNEISLNGVDLAYDSTSLRIRTPYGDSWFGMMNDSYCHIYTSAPRFYMNKPLYVDDGNTVIHSGNIGLQTTLKAYYIQVPYTYEGGNYISDATTAEAIIPDSLAFPAMMQNTAWCGGWSTTFTLTGYKQYGGSQLSIEYNASTPRAALRNYNQSISGWTNWRELAFTDSNVASATKLQTARSIWGQSFDGSANVSGNIKLSNDGSDADIGNAYSASDSTMYNRIKLGAGTTGLEYYAGAYSGINSSLVHKFYVSYQNINALSIANNGNVLIGTPTDNGAKLQVNGGISAMGGISSSLRYVVTAAYDATDPTEQAISINSANYASTYAAWPGIGFHIPGSTYATIKFGSDTCFHFMNYTLSGWVDVKVGNLIATGEVISSRRATSSDARLKDNINRLIAKDCLAMVRNLQPSSWQWKENGEHSMGFIAQDIEPLMPYAVTRIKDDVLGQRLNLQYDQFFAPVVGAIQCLDSEVEQLKRRVKYLENKLQEYGYNRY